MSDTVWVADQYICAVRRKSRKAYEWQQRFDARWGRPNESPAYESEADAWDAVALRYGKAIGEARAALSSARRGMAKATERANEARGKATA